jgi:circadian clock protein KaiC
MSLEPLRKLPTGIQGFDEITMGGLPEGRISLITGGPGSGKTLFSAEFVVHGAMDYGEPGLFVTFEETVEELEKNVITLGFDLHDLANHRKIVLDHIPIERSEIQETGDYDLEGLFVRLGYLIDSIGAKRVVLDTLESLFSGFSNEMILRSELRRLFRWLKVKGVTTIVTAEKGAGTLTRHGLEEYVSDCVITLDHLIHDNIATRRLRVVKYRGSQHGTNEYPFMIGDEGISVLPITSLGLKYEVSTERISTGLSKLDDMLGGKGLHKGSSVLVSGTAGTGKSSFVANFAESVAARGDRCLYLAFEESENQIVRNMSSIGLDLNKWIKRGLLQFHNVRPTLYGLEMHLVKIHDLVIRAKPQAVIFDPISNLVSVGTSTEVKSMLTRLIDYLKMMNITTYFTNLIVSAELLEATEVGVSSLMDTWIVLRAAEFGGECNRQVHIVKSRGMSHSNQLREFQITDNGIHLLDVYKGRGSVLTGSARAMQEAHDESEGLNKRQHDERRIRDTERNRKILEAQIAALQAQLAGETEELRQYADQEQLRERERLVTPSQSEAGKPAGARKKPARR